MNTNGFLLREAIRRWELRRDTFIKAFPTTLYKFENESKANPEETAKAFLDAETAIAKLQCSQSRYNLKVVVNVFDEKITLCEAVKRLGGAGRIEKLWREAVSPKQERYSYNDPTERDSTKERASWVMDAKGIINRANKAGAFVGALRAAIAKGNGTDVDVSEIGLDPTLLTE